MPFRSVGLPRRSNQTTIVAPRRSIFTAMCIFVLITLSGVQVICGFTLSVVLFMSEFADSSGSASARATANPVFSDVVTVKGEVPLSYTVALRFLTSMKRKFPDFAGSRALVWVSVLQT